MASSTSRLGNVRAMAAVVRDLPLTSPDPVAQKRKMVAAFCRLLGEDFSAPRPNPVAGLSPRHVETLQRLLEGDSEKQIAGRLKLSPHTVHVYVKALYRHFDVSSRGELLARFVSVPESVWPNAASPD